MLIGLVGLIGSGKDTVANRLVSHHGFIQDSNALSVYFARPPTSPHEPFVFGSFLCKNKNLLVLVA